MTSRAAIAAMLLLAACSRSEAPSEEVEQAAEEVVQAVADKWGEPPTDGSVRITASFAFMLPKSKRRKNAPAPAHVSRPDLDKLARALLDALTGIVYRDDSQVCSLSCSKCYAEQPGVDVRIEEC